MATISIYIQFGRDVRRISHKVPDADAFSRAVEHANIVTACNPSGSHVLVVHADGEIEPWPMLFGAWSELVLNP